MLTGLIFEARFKIIDQFFGTQPAEFRLMGNLVITKLAIIGTGLTGLFRKYWNQYLFRPYLVYLESLNTWIGDKETEIEGSLICRLAQIGRP